MAKVGEYVTTIIAFPSRVVIHGCNYFNICFDARSQTFTVTVVPSS